jgi:hypothetical protein
MPGHITDFYLTTPSTRKIESLPEMMPNGLGAGALDRSDSV